MQHDYIGHFLLATWTARPVFTVRELHMVCMHPSHHNLISPLCFLKLYDVYIMKWRGNIKETGTHRVFQPYKESCTSFDFKSRLTLSRNFTIFQSQFLDSYTRVIMTNNAFSESLIILLLQTVETMQENASLTWIKHIMWQHPSNTWKLKK